MSIIIASECYVFVRVGLFVCLSVRPSDYLKNKEQICIKLLPEVYPGPRTNQLNVGNTQNLLKINEIYRLQLLICYFKYEHNSLPKKFDVFNLRLNSEIHAHSTRNQNKLRIPFVKHNFAKACVRYQLPKTVNSMPRSITNKVHTHSFNGFSTYVKFIFLDTYATDCNISSCYVCSINLN